MLTVRKTNKTGMSLARINKGKEVTNDQYQEQYYIS